MVGALQGPTQLRQAAPRLPAALQHQRLRLHTDGAAYGEAQAVLFHHRDLVEGPPDWPPPWGVQMPPAEEQKVLVMDNERQAAEAEALAALGPRASAGCG